MLKEHPMSKPTVSAAAREGGSSDAQETVYDAVLVPVLTTDLVEHSLGCLRAPRLDAARSAIARAEPFFARRSTIHVALRTIPFGIYGGNKGPRDEFRAFPRRYTGTICFT